jgi:hypothetical protein
LQATAAGREVSPYVCEIQHRLEWRLLRESVLFWRILAVRRSAPLTSELLMRQGRLNRVVEEMIQTGAASPYVTTMAERFLERVADDTDSLVAATARTEMALQNAARGDETVRVIEWPVDPNEVMASLLNPESVDCVFNQFGSWLFEVSRSQSGVSGRAAQMG